MMRHTAWTIRWIVIALLVSGAGVTSARATDHVRMVGSDVALRECDVIDVRGGRVVFRNARGRRDWRDVDRIAALGFDGLPQLDQAEALLSGRQRDAGLRALLRALLAAPADSPERRWVLVRLVREHADRTEPIPAIAHFADLVAMDDDGSWIALAERIPPRGDAEATYPQCLEAQVRVERARAACRNRSLVERLDGYRQRIDAQRNVTEAAWRGPDVTGDDRRSGYLESEITGAARVPTDDPPARGDAPAAGSDDAITALLDGERFAEAVTACEAAIQAANDGTALPDDQLATILLQYGDALRGMRRPRDAALMYLRAALLLPDEPQSVDGYLAAARLYRDDLGDRATAQRLAQRALDHARGLGHDGAVRRALQLVASFESAPNP